MTTSLCDGPLRHPSEKRDSGQSKCLNAEAFHRAQDSHDLDYVANFWHHIPYNEIKIAPEKHPTVCIKQILSVTSNVPAVRFIDKVVDVPVVLQRQFP